MAPRRVSIPAPLLATLCGTLLGLATFAGAATLWRSGQHLVVGPLAEAILIATLASAAAVVVLAQPARQRRARVPAGRPLPLAWWPVPGDPLPLLAVAAGTPLAAGAAAAAFLFR